MKIFQFIQPEHPFYRVVSRFRDAVEAVVVQMKSTSTGMEVHAEIKADYLAPSQWKLNRLYWSLQQRNGQPARFDSLTAYLDSTQETIRFYRFPEDPYLDCLAPFFKDCQVLGQSPRILRYVPLRRVTFLAVHPAASGQLLVGKCKRRSRLKDSYLRLAAMSESRPSRFAVPKLLYVDEARCVFYQERMEGSNLAELVNEDNIRDLLYAAGEIHQHLHSLSVPGAPACSNFLKPLLREIDWVVFLMPQTREFLASLSTLMTDYWIRMASLDPVFCHGDYACSQLLLGHKGWSVVDFDLAGPGDPYREIAMFIASLKYDIPNFKTGRSTELAEIAGAWYLEGYQKAANKSLVQKRLTWFRIAAEIHYLALMLKKDWFTTESFETSIAAIRDLTSQLLVQGRLCPSSAIRGKARIAEALH